MYGMQGQESLFCGTLVLPDRLLPDGAVHVAAARIQAVGARADLMAAVGGSAHVIDAADGTIAPGYVDLHVHGGGGADFMDGTPQAFATVLAAHARHGTTSLLPTTTAARSEPILAVLSLCRQWRDRADAGGARVLGAHLYGPYFQSDARGCHPREPIHAPDPREYEAWLNLADGIATASVAPELPGAEEFCRACRARGIRMNAGHSHATFEQMAAAVEWGVRHVDHLYCAMSDKSKLRQQQVYPMRGGVLEATLFFDELTTEVIADGKHLSADLLSLALKIKGTDRLALVTDCSRALDQPDGRYMFGPLEGGEPFLRDDGVGKMPDGQALASSVQGMDHMVRTFVAMTGCAVWEAVRMASLTPARIAGWDAEIGSLSAGKRADVLVLSPALEVRRVFLAGRELPQPG